MAKDDTEPALERFADDERGAVTVDWIVLTGSIVFLCIGASFYITSSVPKVANAITTYMDEHELGDD